MCKKFLSVLFLFGYEEQRGEKLRCLFGLVWFGCKMNLFFFIFFEFLNFNLLAKVMTICNIYIVDLVPRGEVLPRGCWCKQRAVQVLKWEPRWEGAREERVLDKPIKQEKAWLLRRFVWVRDRDKRVWKDHLFRLRKLCKRNGKN